MCLHVVYTACTCICVGANTMQVMSLVSIPSILGAHTLMHMRTMIVPHLWTANHSFTVYI